jgi:hypothetical protein
MNSTVCHTFRILLFATHRKLDLMLDYLKNTVLNLVVRDARVEPGGVTGLGAVRGCQPRALGLAVRCQLIPIHLGWVIAWVVSPGILGWHFAAMAIPE